MMTTITDKTSAVMSWPLRLVIMILALSLAACAGPGLVGKPQAGSAPTAPANSGRYELENDVPLLEPFDLSQVKPVVPQYEPRTIAGNMSPYTVNGRTYRVLESEVGYAEIGVASWYGRKFHGHKTSNGEIYDMFQLSAAHKSLPIPSYLNVTNLDNGKSLIVRVNDRGPFHDGRVVDLSYAAAAILGYAGNGTARVRIEAVLPDQFSTTNPATRSVALAGPVTVSGGSQYLQVGAFSSLAGAQALQRQLAGLTHVTANIHSDSTSSGTMHRVRLGPLDDKMDLSGLIKSIVDAGLGTPFPVSQ